MALAPRREASLELAQAVLVRALEVLALVPLRHLDTQILENVHRLQIGDLLF